MKKKSFYKYFILFSFCAISCNTTFAQKDSLLNNFLDAINVDDLFSTATKKSYFKLQTSYLTNYVYAGRKDTSTNYPYLTPSIEYNHKSGLYASVSLSYLANDSAKIDVYNVEAGYSINTKGKFSGTIYLNKSFYNATSNNIQNDVAFTTGLSIIYDAKFANFTASNYILVGSSNDYSLTISADHSFYFGNDSSYTFTITPTLTTYFGSTGFYQNFKTKRGIKGFPPGTTITKTSPNKFQQLSYEFSLPIYFDKIKWGIFLTPTLAIPVNPIITTYTAIKPNGMVIGARSTTENISNSFFAELGVYFKF